MSTDVHTLSGAYALDALAAEEAAEFRRHLDECQACREEVRELQAAVARMGAAEASVPPPALKARVLAAAERTPQQPPAGHLVAEPGGASRDDDIEGGRSPRWVTWLAAAAAVAVIAGAGAVGIRAVVDDEPVLNQAVVEVFEAEDAKTATVETTNGGELTVAVSESSDKMAVDTRSLPELTDEQVYQIWTVHGDEMVSAAILGDPGAGAAMGLPDGASVALTVEPSGGSEQPTTAPIVQLDPSDVLES